MVLCSIVSTFLKFDNKEHQAIMYVTYRKFLCKLGDELELNVFYKNFRYPQLGRCHGFKHAKGLHECQQYF